MGNCVSNNVDYAEVRDAIATRQSGSTDVLLVDVRSPSEVRETGMIPTAINVPVSDVERVLSSATTPAAFEECYRVPKPDQVKTMLIFYCAHGVRGVMGRRTAASLGYQRTRVYFGSWSDWAKRSAAGGK
mmetsp:Transcript_33254/g.38719  ORF Transcript_33254/g.38719 Transcript_33254/m.38719 type:complete len:130 (-) Transcript_33254:88-477(-)